MPLRPGALPGAGRFGIGATVQLLNCSKKGIRHLPIPPENLELLRGKNALTVYIFGTGVTVALPTAST